MSLRPFYPAAPNTSWLADPSRDLTVIVMTWRMFESPDQPQVHPDIEAAAYAALA